MKTIKLGILIAGTFAGVLMGFSPIFNGTVKGRVIPPEGANGVWVVSPTDTLKTSLDAGAFEIRNLKAGLYTIIIEARPPYKNAAKAGITVADGQVMDLGEIILMQ
jgi:hypothetical protein